jgi:hypothetical protein
MQTACYRLQARLRRRGLDCISYFDCRIFFKIRK